MRFRQTLTILVVLLCAKSLFAVTPTPAELDARHRWVVAKFDGADVARVDSFLSFRIGDEASKDVLARSKVERASRKIDEQRVARTITWIDPRTKLIVRCEGVEYLDFPTVEWTLQF